MSVQRPAAVVILAAGEGTRMRSRTPKVLHRVCGRSLLGHVLETTRALEPRHLLVVVGHGREQVAPHVREQAPEAQLVVQAQLHGTGHAVRLALEAVGPLEGPVIVLPGDAPLVTTDTLRLLLDLYAAGSDSATVLSAVVPDPTGYGRVIRNDDGHVRAILEHRDATGDQRALREINSGMYAFDGRLLDDALHRLTRDNVQQEEYLTDVLGILVSADRPVDAFAVPDHREVLAVNDRVQLADVRRMMRDRLLEKAMLAGVTVVDPATTWLGVDVTFEPDVVVHQNTQLHGRTHLSEAAEVGPDTTLRDVTVGRGAVVTRTVAEQAEVGAGSVVGPFAYLRAGTRLADDTKVGTYVEIKNSSVGAGSKVPHLSYVGDADIGEGTNIGAATVFVNYDGVAKHRTSVGDHARTGADNMFVAPVRVGDGAYTAAGSVITEDVPAGAMAVARARQRNIKDWVARRRPGTPAAEAAGRASDTGHVGHDHSGDQDGERGEGAET